MIICKVYFFYFLFFLSSYIHAIRSRMDVFDRLAFNIKKYISASTGQLWVISPSFPSIVRFQIIIFALLSRIQLPLIARDIRTCVGTLLWVMPTDELMQPFARRCDLSEGEHQRRDIQEPPKVPTWKLAVLCSAYSEASSLTSRLTLALRPSRLPFYIPWWVRFQSPDCQSQ